MTTAASSTRKGSAEKLIPHTRIEEDAMIQENYTVGNKIGQGSFGKVYEATHKATGVKWAIKSINKEKAGSSALKLVEREVSILKRVSHPTIITLNEVIESPKKMYLVMEMCTGGELADVLKEKKYFTEAETKIIMGRLSGGIAYLHKHGIVHRDLKLENILMAENPENPHDKLHVKVTDFGLSVVKGGVTPDSMMQDFCGTPMYMAPEILDNKSYSQQCDVWALGIIMYMLLCGYPPFRAKDESVLYELIREANVKFDDKVWTAVSEEGKNCILGMLKLDPAHRLSAAEVLNHHWITGETRDTSQPSNVLEMMKMWKDELKNDDSSSLDEPRRSEDLGNMVDSSMDPSGTCDFEDGSDKVDASLGSARGSLLSAKFGSSTSSTGKLAKSSSRQSNAGGPRPVVPRATPRTATPNSGSTPSAVKTNTTSNGTSRSAGKASTVKMKKQK